MVECLEVAIDGREVIAAAQCSDGGLTPSEPVLGCDPLPEVPGDEVCSGAVVPLCCGVPVCGALVPGDVAPGVWARASSCSGAAVPPVRVGAVVAGGAVTGGVISALSLIHI